MNAEPKDIYDLILSALYGIANEQQEERLVQCLESDPEARKEYVDFLVLYAHLHRRKGASLFLREEESILNENAWEVLAEQEKTAAAVPIERPVEESEIQRPQKTVIQTRVSKFSIYSLILSSAALLFIIAYAHFVPVSRGIEVATLSDSLNAKWSDSDRVIRDGIRLATKSDPLWLREGVAKVIFDNGSTVVLEGPAEFEILTDDQIQLHYGRLYATVPQEAMGFTVSTANSKIIDLGTEFGVKADIDGTTSLHVLKGKTSLVSGTQKNRSTVEVYQGQARAVEINGMVREILLQKESFIRTFNSQSRFVWRGQKMLDLADLASGGNGLGTGRRGYCIHPATGEFLPVDRLSVTWKDQWEKAESYLKAVEELPCVDCVIVPGRNGGEVPITTTGISIQDFPKLFGSLRWPIQTQTYFKEYPLVLNGQTVGTQDRSVLLIHANCGITFDLDALRQSMPAVDLVSLQTVCGINETKINVRSGYTAEVRIYLDGQEVLNQTLSHVHSNAVPIRVDLKGKAARFLTLLVTCGSGGNDNDWCIFAEPGLFIEAD